MIPSSQGFELGNVACSLGYLTSLSYYPAGPLNLAIHPTLVCQLRRLEIRMPTLTLEFVQSLFKLERLESLWIVEPKRIVLWTVTFEACYQNLREFGYGDRGVPEWCANRHRYFGFGCPTVPLGFVEAITSAASGLNRLRLLHLSRNVLLQLIARNGLQELEILFPSEEVLMPLGVSDTPLQLLLKLKLRRLCMSVSGNGCLTGNSIRTAVGCKTITEGVIADFDSCFPLEPAFPSDLWLEEQFSAPCDGGIPHSSAIREWDIDRSNWITKIQKSVCADEDIYRLARPFLHVVKDGITGIKRVRVELRFGSTHRGSGHGGSG